MRFKDEINYSVFKLVFYKYFFLINKAPKRLTGSNDFHKFNILKGRGKITRKRCVDFFFIDIKTGGSDFVIVLTEDQAF